MKRDFNERVLSWKLQMSGIGKPAPQV